jgi:hypothetical protein
MFHQPSLESNRWTFEREWRLHVRYRRLKLLGSKIIVWLEAGRYYVPDNPVHPYWESKVLISLDDFARLIEAEETLWQKRND